MIDERRLLVAGWPGILGSQTFVGLEREVRELTRFRGSEGFEVTAWTDPTKEQLFREIAATSPHMVHLSPIGMMNEDGPSRFPVAPAVPSGASGPSSSEPDFDYVDIDELAEHLGALADLVLVVLNTQESLAMTTELGRRLGVVTLGWDGVLDDQMASDYAVHLYERIAEGLPPFRASRRFVRRFATYQTIHGARPVVWIPNAASLDAPVVPAVAPSDLAGGSPEIDAAGGPEVEIVFDPQRSLFPSLLKNGRSAIERLNITSNIEETVHVAVVCDTGAGTSSYGETRRLHFGDNRFEPESIVFPILYELMDSDARRRINLQVTVSAIGGTVLGQVTKSVDWRGRNEWLDRREAWPFIPSFVQPMADAVATIAQRAHDVLTQIGEPGLSLDGYQSGDEGRVDLQMRSIYQALRQELIKYINPPSSPVHSELGGGQLVRSPDLVLGRRHGTCHDLALLFAAVSEYVGLYPVVIIVPGHTYFGYWRDPAQHDAFWAGVKAKALRPLTGLGAEFMLTGRELRGLAESGHVQLVEATDVTRPEVTFAAACEHGFANLSRGFDAAIDVWKSREQIQPL